MQKKVLPLVFVFSFALLPLEAQSQLPPPASGPVDYEKDVKPLLAQNCYSCHGPEVQQSGLRLDRRQNALRGGDYGPVIVPGKSADSKLIHRLVSGDGGIQMPPTGALLSEEIGVLRAWIDQGAEIRNDVVDEAPPKPVDPRLATLIAAVRSESRVTVEPLVVTNPELVTATDPAGSTLLHHAAGFGAVDALTLLLDAGADVNAENRRRSTALYWGHLRLGEGPPAAGARRRRKHQAGRGPHACLSGGVAREWQRRARAAAG